ncbi:MAG: efflux RND transporter periplasmic adaptor subunit [Kiritimatiellae bacterium]|jgi:Cu(I)/Ag(I) efflux system membrane fusion protein|nr:efflux RND transporter periplasmic adaptor subunit [Kiritimatiellia bacterium]
MKKNIKLLLTLCGLLLLGFLLGRYLFPASDSQDPSEGSHAEVSEDKQAEATIWTCSMHPSVQQTEPGDCPICGMDLIPLQKDTGGDAGPRSLLMSESAKALAEIQTTEVIRAFPEAELRLVGKLGYDQTLEKSLTARFPARIDTLYVNYSGIPVKQGEHLAKVYSPELLSAQQELLTAYRSNPNSSITFTAREKLRLWDLLPEQIDEILDRGEARDQFILRAPIGGVVTEKNVEEGSYVKTGQPLFRIVDLSELWLNMDAYESDLAWLRYGQAVAFTVEAFPGEMFHGTIAFLNPEVNRKTRTVAVRVNVPNPEGRLKPGMFAKGKVAVKLADEGKVYEPALAGKWISPMHPEIVKDGPGTCDVCGMDLVPAEALGYANPILASAPLIIPASAVLRTGKRAVVYVETPNTDRPMYEGREIVLGPKAGEVYLVASGLEAGERVVTHGAFKIDSALQIQAKPSMMNPLGGGPAPGHNHGGMTMPEPSQSMLMIDQEAAEKILPAYLEVQKALADDDFATAQAQVKAMMTVTGHEGSLAEFIHGMLNAKDVDALLLPHFEKLSTAMIAALREPSIPLYRMHCPMASGDKGADWLQANDELRNPYFGASMLSCGETVEVLGE